MSAATVGTLALHLVLFGGDRYFALRFLLSPVENPISFAAFVLTLVLLTVALVRASRVRAWSVLKRTSPRADTGISDFSSTDAGPDATDVAGVAGANGREGAEFVEQPVEKPLPAFVVPGAVTRRALRAAAMVAVLNALFMIVFPIAVIPMFAVIFLIAAALIAAIHIVLRAVRDGTGGS